MEDVQEMVRLDPSVMILSGLGSVEIMDMADEFIEFMKRTREMKCHVSILFESLLLKNHDHSAISVTHYVDAPCCVYAATTNLLFLSSLSD